MCEKCGAIDLRIQKYQRLLTPPVDPHAKLRLMAGIAELEAAKAAIGCQAQQHEC
jgi:hypothetical protein